MTEIAIGDRISASTRWSHGRNKLHINNTAKCKFSSVIPRSWSPKSWIQFLSFHYRHPSDRIELHNLLLFTDQQVRKFRNIWLKMDRNSQKLTFEDSINSLQKHMSYNFSLVVKNIQLHHFWMIHASKRSWKPTSLCDPSIDGEVQWEVGHRIFPKQACLSHPQRSHTASLFEVQKFQVSF